jgi:hypothetical protein
VNRERGQLLARARFAGDEHRRLGRAAFVDAPVQLLHRLALTDHAMPPERRFRRYMSMPQRRQPMRVAEREHETLVEPRPRNEVEAVIEDKAADQFVIRLARRDLRDPVGFGAAHARSERGQLLRRAVFRQFDQTNLDVVALDHAFRARRVFRVHGMPARCGEEVGEFLIGRARHIKNGASGVRRCESHFHYPRFLLLERLLCEILKTGSGRPTVDVCGGASRARRKPRGAALSRQATEGASWQPPE